MSIEDIKEKILSADDKKIKPVDIPEWGLTKEDVGIKTMSGTERDDFELSLYSEKGRSQKENLLNLRSRLIVKVLIYIKTGKRIFKDKEALQLGKKSSIVLDKLYAIAQEHNGLRKQDIEEITKNSDETQNEESTLD